MKKTEILYISYDGITDPLGQSQILPYILKLNDLGYKFTILSCEKKDTYNKSKDIIKKKLDSVGVSWEFVFYTKKPPIFSSIYDYLRLRKRATGLHIKNKYSIIHCRSYIPSMIGVYLKRRFGVKFLFDMRGFWADERVDGCLWDRRNTIFNKIYLFFKRQERQFIESADHIVSLTYSGAEEIKKWDYIDKENLPLSVIPCCVDTNLFNRDNISEVDLDEKRNELGLKKDDIIISYLGSIGTWYLLDEMLQFFKVFVGVEPRAKFLFITEDSHETIKSKGRNMNINNERIITTSSERLFVPLYLALSNFSIFFIKPVYSKKSSSPTKQGELMSMGVPVICNANIGDTDWVVDKYNSGLIVSSLDKDQYRKVIDKMFRAKFISNDIRNGAVDYFSLENGVEKYAKIYASISQEII